MPHPLAILTHVLALLALPPLLLGVIAKTKACFAGRVGAPVLQPYYDLAKLFRKDMVTSRTTTWVFAAGPVVGLVVAMAAGLLVPLGGLAAPVHFTGDLVLLAYLFALGRFFTTAAALDTGSAFEGMGAARDATFACFAEPAVFLGFLVLALGQWANPGAGADVTASGHDLSLTTLLGGGLVDLWAAKGASLVLVLAALFMVLLAENCRIPFDDPNTHLELTMIHEVMVLDHSGPALGAILYGAALKLFVLGAILVRVAVPVHTRQPALDWAVFVAGMLLLSVLVGVVESVMARLRLRRVPLLLTGACAIAALAFLLLVTRP